MDATEGHLRGSTVNGYCASYYKLYTDGSQQDMSWQNYAAQGDYYWSKCDNGK